MGRRTTRGEFLADACTTCLCVAAGGLLTQGCRSLPAVDAERARPRGAPASFIARADDVKAAFYFVKGTVKGVLVRIPGGIVGYRNKCTHQGAPCALREGALVCVWHGSAFDPATGKVVRGPAQKPLEPLKLEIRDGLVLLARGK